MGPDFRDYFAGESILTLTLATHDITDMQPGSPTKLIGSLLQVDMEELRRYLLEDARLEDVDLEIAAPGDSFRAGYVVDIVEPRVKEPGSGSDFPGILGPMVSAGQGVTHVLVGAAVTVVDGGQPGGEHGYISRRGGMAKVLETTYPDAKLNHGLFGNTIPHPHWHMIVRRENDPDPKTTIWESHFPKLELSDEEFQETAREILQNF